MKILRALRIASRIVQGTVGSVLFISTGGKLGQNNANFFWDNINNRLGIGTTTPNQKLTIEGTMDLKEQTTVSTDTIGYGQLWVKDDVPNSLMFSDDAGNDINISDKLSEVIGTDRAVGKSATQTLTNKILTSPALNTPVFSAGAVGTVDIADLAVSNAKLANGAVTLAKTTNMVGTDANAVQVRYGSFVTTTNASAIAIANYASAFPTATITVTCTNGDPASGNILMTPYTGSLNTSFSFNVRQADTGAIIASAIVRINYIAIGY